MIPVGRRTVLEGVLSGAMLGAAGCSSIPGVSQESVGTIELTGSGFEPCNADVPEESTVMWENTSETTHTVTSASDNWDMDVTLEPGAVVQNEFSRQGVYDAVCTEHGSQEEFTGERMRLAVGDVEYEQIDCG